MEAIAIFDPIGGSEPLRSTAREMGFKVISVFTKTLSTYTESLHISENSLYQNTDEIIFSGSPQQILQELKSSGYKIKASISASELGVELADQIADKLNLFRNPIELSSARRNKAVMRKLIKENGFSCPDFILCHSEKDLLDFAQSHSFPLVIKTPVGAGTSHVYVCQDTSCLIEKFKIICQEEDVIGNRTKSVIVEEYISGREFIVDTFSDGCNVFVTDIWSYDKIDTKEFKNVYYNLVCHDYMDLSFKDFRDQAVKLAKLFRIDRGVAHFEFKNDPKRGITLIEVNARLPGARIPAFLKRYTSFDPYKSTIEVFTFGKTSISNPIIYEKYFAVACCPIFQRGKVKKISGLEQIQKLKSYECHELKIKEEDIIIPTTHLFTTPLLVFLANADADQLMSDLKKAHKLFSVEIDESSPLDDKIAQ